MSLWKKLTSSIGLGNLFSPLGPIYSFGKKMNNPLDPGGVVKSLFDRKAKERQDANADATWLKLQQMNMADISNSEMAKYNSGELTEGQQANITRQEQIQRAQLKQGLASGGIADSSAGTIEQQHIYDYGAGLAENYREQHWDAAMKALGMEADVRNTIHQMNVEHMQENIQVYAGIMSILGGAAGTWAGGSDTDKSPVAAKKDSDNTSWEPGDISSTDYSDIG